MQENNHKNKLKLCVFLTDPMEVLYKKGEIKNRYYNPCNYFDEIHMISFCSKDIEEEKVRIVAGDARLKIYSVGKLSIFSLLALRHKILSLIKEINPDVIRAYDPSLRGALAVYAGRKLNLPTILSVHNHLDEQRKFDNRIILKFRILLERYSLRRATKVICVSNYVKSYADKYGARDVCVLYNRVDLEQFRHQQNKNSDSRKEKVLLNVSRLDRQKYQECLIKAIAGLDVKLILIGNGRLYKSLNNLVKNMNLKNRVVFIKSVFNNQIRDYYLSADIFVLPTKYEGFCIPIIEAMAASLPIVATDIAPISEILGDAGILVNNNPEEFKRAIKMIIENNTLRELLRAKAYERSKIFDSITLEEREKGIYQKFMRI